MILRKQNRLSRPAFLSSVELMFYLPIVIVTFLAVVQFSQILAAEARMSAGSREGARVAASGGNCRQIHKAVFAALLPGEKKFVTIETNAMDSQGSPANLPPGSEVVVRVSVPARDIVPSALLLVIGKNRVLVGQTVMRKE